MVDGEERTSGGGFEAVVRRGVFKTRKEAKVAAYTKAVHNLTRAVENSEAIIKQLKSELTVLKKDLSDVKKGLKYWEAEPEEE